MNASKEAVQSLRIEDENFNGTPQQSHAALIKDLTEESVVILDDRESRECYSRGNNVGAARIAEHSQNYNIVENKAQGLREKKGDFHRRPTVKIERLDHDYGDYQGDTTLSPLTNIPKEKELSKEKMKTLLHCTEEKAKVYPKESSISRVKNINELKKVTPKVKLLSPEVTNLSQLTRINVQSWNTEGNGEASLERSRHRLKNYCRTCAGLKVPLVDIFSEKGLQMRLNQQMKHLEEIKQEDSLSTQMCMDCICDLKMSYKFFMQIKKAQVKLQSINLSLQATMRENARLSENERLRICGTNAKSQTTRPSVKMSCDKSEILPRSVDSPVIEKTRVEAPFEGVIKVEPEFTLQLSDNESIEEFDPFQPDTSEAAESEGGSCEYVPEILETNRENHSERMQKEDNPIIAEENNPPSINNSSKLVNNKGSSNEDDRDINKTVYQYDTNLGAYIKLEPASPPPQPSPPPLPSPSPATENDFMSLSLIKSKLPEKSNYGSSNDATPCKQPNILKRKVTIRKDFLENPEASGNASDTTFAKFGERERKKPKLNVENAVNITNENENENGIMYVTVKGTKPNELLLVKVKKMDRPAGESKKNERKKQQTQSNFAHVDEIEKRMIEEAFGTTRDKDYSAKRSKALDMRERMIANQIEEYKKKREKVLGGTAGLPNALKFEDGTIRFVNPIEKAASGEEIKVEPLSEELEEIRRLVVSRSETMSTASDKNENKSETQVERKLLENPVESAIRYSNTGEYLSRLAKLKRKWEEAKKKKESLRRELAETYTEGNLEKLGRILGEREKNLREFQDYLKQRKIVITRLKDEDIISLYEDRNNVLSGKKNFPDLIDATTPTDYIAQENYLECDYCPETFGLCDLLEEHLKSHDYKLMYYCEDCQEEFPSVKAKRGHNVSCIKKLICKYCDLLLESKGKKRQHEQKHVDSIYGQLCEVCGEKFKHQGTLDQHFKTQHMTWEKIYECPKCPKKFAFKQKLSFHLKSVHTSLRAYLCEDCGADFKNPASLRHHRLRKHHPTGNKRECPVCNKLVPFYSLSKHMYTHKAYTIQCPHCDKMFKNSSTLKQHLRIHEDQRQYRCDTCGVGFNRRDGLKLHMRVHQKTDSRALKECSCQICSEKFPNHSMLVIHRNRVHKDGRQYTCHICNRSMLSTRSLEWHMSHIHNEALPDGGASSGRGEGGGGLKDDTESAPEKKRVSCINCDKTFKTEMILRTHIKNTHMEKDPTKCLDCELTFTSDVRLRHHMMVAHNRLDGTLPCPHCSKRFVNQLRLKTHMISHSEDRPYTCEICGFNLKTKIQLIKHHQNRHSNERPLQCRYCPWRCKQVSALVCHERTHTNERPYSCIVCRQRFKYLGDKNKHERRHESLGGSGFKRIVAGRNLKQPKTLRTRQEDTSTSDQDNLDYDNQEDDEQEEKYQQQQRIVTFHESNEISQQEYEETSREASEATEVIMNMEDTTVYTEEVTADNIESAEMISDEIMTNEILQSGTVVHLQQQDDTGKIQVIPVMLSLPDLSDSSAEVNLATASIMYNN